MLTSKYSAENIHCFSYFIKFLDEMSTFKGLISEIEGISIDRFIGKNLNNDVFFLSHCHTDHMRGFNWDFVNHLRKNPNKRIYMSNVSSVLAINMVNGIKDFVQPLSINESHLIKLPSKIKNTDYYINVTLISAGHCPGSVMFLFEDVNDQRILYTGDIRMSLKDLQQIEALHNHDRSVKNIHKMYFDSTFWNEKYEEFPNRDQSCDVICDIINEWISASKNNIVYLKLPANYGSEYVFMEIFKRLKMPVYVNNKTYQAYKKVVDLDGSVTIKNEITQIFAYIKNINCHNMKIRTVFPSAMRWAYVSEKIFENSEKDTFNVCYSSHCSFGELKAILSYLKPQSIEPCVVPKINISQFYESINQYCKDFLKISLSLHLNQNDNLDGDDSIESDNENEQVLMNIYSSESEDEPILKNETKVSKLVADNVNVNKNRFNKKIKFF